MTGVARLFVATTVLAAGCTVGPNYRRPPVLAPEDFKSAPAGSNAALLAPEWWRLYGESDLDQLIATANGSNQTIGQAVAAVDQARALARAAGSHRYPEIALDPGFARTRTSATRVSALNGRPVSGGATFNDWLAPVTLSYEVDVWGRIRRSLESARAQARASADDEAAVRLAVQTDIAQDYYAVRSLDAQIDILGRTVVWYREQVRLLSAQVSAGIASAVALRQGEALLQATLAQQHEAVRARADLEHAVAILCGQAAPSFTLAASPLLEVSPPTVPAALPAVLLFRRPDVAAAEQQVVAANAQVGVATASLYPTFSLASTVGFESANLLTLFDWRSRIASMILGMTLPIFQGGRQRATLDATRAQYRQTVAAYVNQVLIAYGDVEDALTDLHAHIDEVARYRDAANAAQEYLRLAQVQYRTGLTDYLLVTDAERTLLANQLSLAQTVNLQQAASIRLIRSLGGGWEAE